ncbi:hypothetical protein [Tropicimonas marinistellae]|uniref:hypothetical protein n=1 Tax=Tropicimonas marinistellae TaxID=1739787 RepID=UPI0008299E86|nr:hypothetical protein [Tropicimonas marinistellae]
MAKLVFNKAHDFHFGYAEFENYSIKSFDAKSGKMTLKYDASREGVPYDPDRSPWKVTIQLKDFKTYKATDGKYQGDTIVTSGDIESIRWFSKSNKLEVKMTDISLDAGEFHYLFLEHSARTYDNLVADGSTFLGPKGSASGTNAETGSGDDVFRARGGGSYIEDNGGADQYYGSATKWDILSYASWTYDRRPLDSGVKVNLANEKATGPDGLVDKLVNIDQVIGTFKKDTLIGNDSNNTFAGLRGKDVIDGGDGFDRAIYVRDASYGGHDGIVANLSKGTIRDGFGTVDQVKSIEQVDGTNSRDVFTGNNANNRFKGGDAKDKFIFNGKKFGTDTIVDFDPTENDKIQIRAANKFSDLNISTKSGDTHIKLNANSEVILQDYTDGLDSGDFIF